MSKTNHIRYSNCHEDVRLLLKYANKGSNALSIASSLDNSLMLLTKYDNVYAIDSNRNQVSLCKLKIEAIKKYNLDDFKKFYGFSKCPSNIRLQMYQDLRESLDEKTKQYFDSNIEFIEKGLCYSGKFERYMMKFAKYILPLTNSKKNITKFMNFSDIEKQYEFYINKFCNRRFKLLFKIFFSKYFMKKLGRDASCFTYVTDSISTHLLKRIDNGFKNNPNSTNCYLELATLSRYRNNLDYIQSENYNIIKERINNIHIIEGDISEINNIDIKYDFFNLSDIFEYMDINKTKEIENIISLKATNKARVCFWNMINQRTFDLKLISSCDDLSNDRALFYTAFYAYEVLHD